MPAAKTYLNVPYAQKDAAKALGARWDAANKKWYVPAGKELGLFAQWSTEPAPETSALTTSKSRPSAASTEAVPSGITRAADKNFVAYSGDLPPWD